MGLHTELQNWNNLAQNTLDRKLLSPDFGDLDTSGKRRAGSKRGRLILKRLFDAVAAAGVFVLLLPLIVMLTVLILITQGRPVLYAHKRVGRNATTFKCLKFRTMVMNAEEALESHLAANPAARAEWAATRKLKDDPRITPLGQMLRRTSLDELPQLLNIIKGDMSVVGPRPIVAGELKQYGWNIGAYYKSKPGLTGLWQISGRSDTSYEHRVALDNEYERSQSFFGDLKIIAKTIPAVVRARGSY